MICQSKLDGSGSGQQPWISYGLSERTYYRRKAEGTLADTPPPQQHMAHVEDYLRSLDPFARLDFLSYARRCGKPSLLAWKPAHLIPLAEMRA